MMKKCICLLVSILFLICTAVSAAAASPAPFVVDEAMLLTDSQVSMLEQKADVLNGQYHMDFVIVTIPTLSGADIQQYADDYYDSCGYAEDGALFLLAMEEREWYLSTCGNARYALTDYGIQTLGEQVVPYFSEGLYYDAFAHYLDLLVQYLDAYLAGSPLDGTADLSGDYYHAQQEEILHYEASSGPNFVISIIAGLVIAGIAILIMRGSMNTKRPQRSASSYLKEGTYQLHTQRDIFLYSNISKVRRQEDNNQRGGSSVHRSSSGRSHGGGGGKF